jgi:hypothetical protein
MKSLADRISALPQVIQDLISEFNADHRDEFSYSLSEITSPSNFCETCGVYIFDMICSRRNSDMICCSEQCVDDYYLNPHFQTESVKHCPPFGGKYDYIEKHHMPW